LDNPIQEGKNTHIMDGILTPTWIAVWYIIAAAFIIVGTNSISKKRKANPKYMPVLALMGAAVFVISVWHIPVPVTGSSGHPCGTALAAIVIGPFPTAVITAIALFFQLFLAHGGITALGANTASMGIVGGFSGFAVYLVARKLGGSFWLSAGLGGLVGDLLTYATTALQLALNFPGNTATNWTVYMAGFMPTQIPLAIAEFVFTAVTVQYIANHRLDILRGWKK
jgi:cobalt/nickel transport system permease protein